MDFLDFDGEAMYFDEPLDAEVTRLLADASARYGAGGAELSLLQAYLRAPEHLTVLVALYRYFYYRHRYEEALMIAERAIRISATRLGLPSDWHAIADHQLDAAARRSMALTRFLLLAVKGAGYLLMRLGRASEAQMRFETLAALDTSDRLGVTDLLAMARAAVTEAAVAQAGQNVCFLGRH